MGGNALAGLQEVRRYDKDEYFALVKEVKEKVGKAFTLNRIEAIQAYRTKETFGDMDVLMEVTDKQLTTWRDEVCNALGVDAMYADGKSENKYGRIGSATTDKVYTVAYKGLQVDFILTPAHPHDSFDAAYNYFSWNDLGNLLGRVAHSFGFKLGHKGLLFPFTVGTHNFEELLVTKDWNEILPAFGWDPERYHMGFDDLPSVFEYVASSEFFHPDIFLFENRNAKARYRDAKRSTYRDFLGWCQDNASRLPQFKYPEDKKDLLPLAYERLRNVNFQEKYEEVESRYVKFLKFKEKWNGELVSSLTGLVDKQLGQLMGKIRAAGTEEAFQEWILNSDEKRISRMVLSFYESWKNELPEKN